MVTGSRSVASVIRRISGFILLLSLSAIFIWSGWTKLQTIEPFTWSFLDILPLDFTGASVAARLFVGLEWMIGLWLAGHVFLRRLTYKATVVLLLLLSAYLAALIVVHGNKGNCGCFGEWLYMKPAAAIWKNVALLAVVVVLWFLYPAKPYKEVLWVALITGLAAFTIPFAMRPVSLYGTGNVLHQPINLDSLYTIGKPAPGVDLRRGKHILCFFSTTCPHCKKAAYLVQIFHRRYPELPVYMVLNGSAELQDDFLTETKAGDVPHTLMTNQPAFSEMAGKYVPQIDWVNNSIVERETYYTELEPGAVKAWLRK